MIAKDGYSKFLWTLVLLNLYFGDYYLTLLILIPFQYYR